MKLTHVAIVLAALMAGASVVSVAARPSAKTGTPITLETAVPKQFGDWIDCPISQRRSSTRRPRSFWTRSTARS